MKWYEKIVALFWYPWYSFLEPGEYSWQEHRRQMPFKEGDPS